MTISEILVDSSVLAEKYWMLNGKQMRTFTTDRRGKVLTEREVFTQSNGKVYTRVTTNTYDKAKRLITSTVVENGKTAKIERAFGKNGLLSLETFGNKLKRSYTYDIHGWLTQSHLTSLNSIVKTNAGVESDEYYSPLAVVEDGLQLFGISGQYRTAVNNAVKLSTWCGETELTFVGHSLGGGEAIASSMKTGLSAITFNAARLSSLSIVTLGLGDGGNIRNFVTTGTNKLFGKTVGGDPITNFQNNVGMRKNGQYIQVPIKLMNPVASHSIETFINALAR